VVSDHEVTAFEWEISSHYIALRNMGFIIVFTRYYVLHALVCHRQRCDHV